MNPERKEKILAVLAKRQPDITVVFENVFDPHNVSAVMRTCDAVGIQEVFILNTRTPRHKQWGFRSSGSAYKWLTIHSYTAFDECVHAIRNRYDRILTTHFANDSLSMHEVDFTGSLALVFGNEHGGLTEEMLNESDGNFIIPQVGIIKSLNISVACAVTLYEAFRQKNIAGHYNRNDMDHVMKQDLMEKWQLMEEAGVKKI